MMNENATATGKGTKRKKQDTERALAKKKGRRINSEKQIISLLAKVMMMAVITRVAASIAKRNENENKNDVVRNAKRRIIIAKSAPHMIATDVSGGE